MHAKSSRLDRFTRVPRSTQISESHCGPAVLQMLLGFLDISVSQKDIAGAGDALHTIEEQGMRIDQLARAVRNLFPKLTFWFKEYSLIDDLVALLSQYHYPIGVEWQGLFGDDPDIDEGDYGHYSVITHIDLESREIILVDPYKYFADRERVLKIPHFLPRWWDTNEIVEVITNRPKIVEDYRMMFIVTPGKEQFPRTLGMTAADTNEQKHKTGKQ